ncbi:5' nucleotidase, NT5C type [Desulforamulus aquiferis]|uniref:Nucleotidase n=1 Tax=Desulforamulus aquiferis TaxID=1397668 RepID=A0AAW7Z5C1_9FIRM|nr:hypothetical protein [Desulforamulus aquiferis]MDO7785629.1 hypothetical protein [Desulforamulus aquiferis]RYD03214.1 hypothetical protein N752_20495 [Desulforamulus aquiferis]
MKIGIDLDGTIADNLNLLVDTLNTHSGKKLLGDEIYQYNLCKVYSITEDDFINLMEQREEEIISTSPVIPYARRNIKQLVNDGWEVHIITARNPRYAEITEKWLHQQGIPYRGLHLLNSHDKLDVCKELKVRLMIEDNIHNGYQLATGGIDVILYDAPHNRFWPWKGTRCRTWNQVYNSISNQR